jgi:hypothetical protein
MTKYIENLSLPARNARAQVTSAIFKTTQPVIKWLPYFKARNTMMIWTRSLSIGRGLDFESEGKKSQPRPQGL